MMLVFLSDFAYGKSWTVYSVRRFYREKSKAERLLRVNLILECKREAYELSVKKRKRLGSSPTEAD